MCSVWLRAFWLDERGAANIDWVALTASIVVLGIAIVYTIHVTGAAPLVETVNDQLRSAEAGLCDEIEDDMGLDEGDCEIISGDNP